MSPNTMPKVMSNPRKPTLLWLQFAEISVNFCIFTHKCYHFDIFARKSIKMRVETMIYLTRIIGFNIIQSHLSER